MEIRMIRWLALAALIATPALAAPAVQSGVVKHAAYTVCRAGPAVDLGEVGSDTSADCTGIVRTRDGAAALDNLALHCLELSHARKAGYKFTGYCVETDADGDKLYLSYEGPESGPIKVLGGTGKFARVQGDGQWKVADAPGNTATLFAFTFEYDLDLKAE
jgi:hypothetical protein